MSSQGWGCVKADHKWQYAQKVGGQCESHSIGIPGINIPSNFSITILYTFIILRSYTKMLFYKIYIII